MHGCYAKLPTRPPGGKTADLARRGRPCANFVISQMGHIFACLFEWYGPLARASGLGCRWWLTSLAIVFKLLCSFGFQSRMLTVKTISQALNNPFRSAESVIEFRRRRPPIEVTVKQWEGWNLDQRWYYRQTGRFPNQSLKSAPKWLQAEWYMRQHRDKKNKITLPRVAFLELPLQEDPA